MQHKEVRLEELISDVIKGVKEGSVDYPLAQYLGECLSRWNKAVKNLRGYKFGNK